MREREREGVRKRERHVLLLLLLASPQSGCDAHVCLQSRRATTWYSSVGRCRCVPLISTGGTAGTRRSATTATRVSVVDVGRGRRTPSINTPSINTDVGDNWDSCWSWTLDAFNQYGRRLGHVGHVGHSRDIHSNASRPCSARALPLRSTPPPTLLRSARWDYFNYNTFTLYPFIYAVGLLSNLRVIVIV